MTQQKAKIKEIFTSIQGEGPFIGYKQLFIRFCGCNLNCDYCDTDYSSENEFKEFSPQELVDYVKTLELKNIHSVSLTGGEPLIWSEFLRSFLYKVKMPAYLETNATMAENLGEVLEYIDIIAADIKLPSASGLKNAFELHDNFFKALKNYSLDCAINKHFDCENKNIFAKIVFDEKISDEEIDSCLYLAEKYKLDLVLQPKMYGYKLSVTTEQIEDITNKFLNRYKNIRLIPQTHKFLDIR